MSSPIHVMLSAAVVLAVAMACSAQTVEEPDEAEDLLTQPCPQGVCPGADVVSPPEDRSDPGFNWKGTLAQSGLLLATQHSLRMVQAKTRKHLGGPFWRDYVKSVAGLHGWNDGNPVITNYVGHPMMGAVTGYIQIQNDPEGRTLDWDPRNPAYWRSRFKALGWATAYSTSYELAPWGEAGIGNVGYDPGTMGYVDLVVTPLAGFGMVLLEDYLDKKIIERLEQGSSARPLRILRVVMNPQRSIANLLRFKRPSHRDTRPLASGAQRHTSRYWSWHDPNAGS
jgi:hypothetical protein